MIEIKADVKNLKAIQELLSKAPKELHRASIVAIERTVTTLRKETSIAVRKRYVVSAKKVKDAGMKVQKPTSTKLQGIFRVTGAPLPLTAFRLSVRRFGPVRVRVLKSGGLKPIKKLFVRAFPKGYTGPMRRVGESSYPLTTPSGPSIPQMVGHEETLKKLVPIAQKKLVERLEHEVEFRLGRIK